MTLRWSVPSGESRPLLSALQDIMVPTRAEPGCIACKLSIEVGARVVIRHVEEWQDEQHLACQLRSPRFAVLAELMERASEPPFVEFSLHGSTRGLDYAEEVRSAHPRGVTGRRRSIP